MRISLHTSVIPVANSPSTRELTLSSNVGGCPGHPFTDRQTGEPGELAGTPQTLSDEGDHRLQTNTGSICALDPYPRSSLFSIRIEGYYNREWRLRSRGVCLCIYMWFSDCFFFERPTRTKTMYEINTNATVVTADSLLRGLLRGGISLSVTVVGSLLLSLHNHTPVSKSCHFSNSRKSQAMRGDYWILKVNPSSQ